MGLAAMAILESEYKSRMTIEEGKALVSKAIRAGIFNDLGSGGNVDVCVIKKDGGNILRNHEKPNPKKIPAQRAFKLGTTPTISTDILKLVTVESEDVQMVG